MDNTELRKDGCYTKEPLQKQTIELRGNATKWHIRMWNIIVVVPDMCKLPVSINT